MAAYVASSNAPSSSLNCSVSLSRFRNSANSRSWARAMRSASVSRTSISSNSSPGAPAVSSVSPKSSSGVTDAPPSFDVAFLPELVRVRLLVAPRHVRLVVLPVPRLHEDHVVLADPDPLLHPPRDACRPLLPVRTPHLDAVRAEHVSYLREDLVVFGHPEVLASAVVLAHGARLDSERFKPHSLPRSRRRHWTSTLTLTVAIHSAMLDKLGLSGVFGLLLVVVGIAVVAWQAPVVAAGLTAVIVGLALVARGAIQSVMGMFGMA